MSDTVICKNKRCLKEIDAGFRFCPHCGADQRRTRRANGEGCIYTLPNGKYKLDCVIGYDVDDLGKLIPQRDTEKTCLPHALRCVGDLRGLARLRVPQQVSEREAGHCPPPRSAA